MAQVAVSLLQMYRDWVVEPGSDSIVIQVLHEFAPARCANHVEMKGGARVVTDMRNLEFTQVLETVCVMSRDGAAPLRPIG